MVKIKPFRGIFYNPEKIGNFSEVVMPPFDVITKEEQDQAYARHPNNIIRLILGKKSETDTEHDNPHIRASTFFREWLRTDIFRQDHRTAVYLTADEFSHESRRVTRTGFIAAVGIEPFEKGIVVPHEHTFSKVKSERLELMKACHANFSPIFAMYSDRENEIMGLMKQSTGDRQPDITFVDRSGQRHALWRIDDATIHRNIERKISNKRIFIADGHHRYETAMNYRNWLTRNNPDFSAEHPANYVMMYLTSMEDPGLVILPAHRMLRYVSETDRKKFFEKAEYYFTVTPIPFSLNTRDRAQTEFIAALKSNASEKTIGLFMKETDTFYLLRLKTDAMIRNPLVEIPVSLRNLDVTVLTRLVLMDLLGFDQAKLDDETRIGYTSDENDAIEAVADGKFDLAFLLNPTRIEQVRKIAEAGEIMPRKATYFYPKVIAGLVINSLR